ncbi:MAG: hypothetical protein NTW03_08160 [Verrucomicrobia bacterium]|nr:hypothetical protein [Verrucomicrobiota bacterium]
MKSALAASLAGLFAAMAWAVPASATVTVTAPRCEYADDPLGLDSPRPRLNWVLESNQRAQSQTAYQILVASSDEKLKAGQADLWDSGKVTSDQSIQIAYAGKPLASRQRCVWRVRVWDQDGNTAESAPAFWEMGLLQASPPTPPRHRPSMGRGGSGSPKAIPRPTHPGATGSSAASFSFRPRPVSSAPRSRSPWTISSPFTSTARKLEKAVDKSMRGRN